MYHKPVMLEEAIEALNIKKGRNYIDCNLGGGGHTAEILRIGGNVLAFDIDENAIKHCKERFSKEIEGGFLKIANRNFKDIDEVAKENGLKEESVSGILYDLGTSTFQLKEEKKGFSFDDGTELDMRMDNSVAVTAYDLLVVLSEKQIEKLIVMYGEEPQAKKFAKVIKEAVKSSSRKLLASEIAELIKKSSRYSHSRIHPATRVFQALRIAVNSELENLRLSLERATPLLSKKGRLVVISFHSLEENIVKEVAGSQSNWLLVLGPKAPTDLEVEKNPSSRSAKMYVFERK
ncbi:16S rRNA (cytosine(1402)-N(4))-methyltransferase [candidate division WWE3 bacterium CG_4_9_14_0_2_um_filter_35_11]|uniref:Ribosomal RNA small subunit methyltransferase H n=1 Tax=candidate division WWE3 bacterium CG_4_9_14_0_2_um_filter_35_11 TaxID=1975077 RepID=A0A2M8EMC2_UNCKA|nr:MAG: 16S rRNA (cytosine(1402)-N(4))-methyltransferase [candidate division WWE3 bacterium CG10_big_fil_rev_8_21_14_0_10_35_32]PJC23893.1 MAG: 16S rRNA (cytosine(1402)-N(4))-methyltransferase [candidate division WWE3 bacterium CG_4_9_14_0_2_um_filter_35_11]